MEDLPSLPLEDLQEEYKILFKRFHQMREVSENDAQRIYDLQRNLNTANANTAYLAQELEQISSAKSPDADSFKIQTELEEIKRKYHELLQEHTNLQIENEALSADNTRVSDELKKVSNQKQETNETDLYIDQVTARVSLLERENDELLQKMEELRDEVVSQTMNIAERDKKIEILSEQLTCVEENLRFKRDELEEKTQILESTQEQLCEANSKIALLSIAPDNKDRKGNSLFAEVDDQRQAMKQLLAAQKKNYLQMKKVFNESQFEIRRLKRENIAMHTELETCSSIFCNADKIYNDKRNERIQHLLNQNEEMEQKLKWTQERLKDLAVEKGVNWIESMLNFCKKETEDYKEQLYSIRIQNAFLDEQLRNSQQQMARWRFEALKSRCVLIDREELLSEHKITFKPKTSMQLNMSDTEIDESQPRIKSVTKCKISTSTICDDVLDVNVEKTENEMAAAFNKEEKVKILNEDVAELIADGKAEQLVVIENIPEQTMLNNSVVLVKAEIDKGENKENETETESSKTDITHVVAATAANNIVSEKSSILCKNRSVFQENCQKNVQFSEQPVKVHNYQNELISEETAEKNNSSETTIVKEVRTKSNILIRRVFVAAKPNGK